MMIQDNDGLFKVTSADITSSQEIQFFTDRHTIFLKLSGDDRPEEELNDLMAHLMRRDEIMDMDRLQSRTEMYFGARHEMLPGSEDSDLEVNTDKVKEGP